MSGPRGAGGDKRIGGVVIGLVADVVDPDQAGRVQITLPWYAAGYKEWARVAQPYAGADFGSTWVPEVDTEVLVAFAHGDMRYPYVLGCLHGKVDTSPAPRTSSSDVKMLKTPAGSELTFDETKQTIVLKTPGGASVTLEETSGALALEATQKISMSAPSISIDGSSEVAISGGTVRIN